MELQKNILLFFSRIDSPFLDKLVEVITMFGESVFPLAIALFLLWCVDKKTGVVSTTILLTACVCMSTLKALVRFPRPWVVIPELQTGRIETATGYSFPSGHSTIAASFYSSVAFGLKKKAISIVCAVLVLLVPVSRLYLCVHWPLDVFCGMVLGVGTTIIFFNWFAKIYDNRKKYFKQIAVVGIVLSVIGLVQAVLVQAEVIDFLAYSDFSKNLAMFGGVLIGFVIEEKNLDFATDGTIKQKALRYVVGLIVAMILLEGVKAVLPYVPVVSFFRYFAVAMWASLYPVVGKKLKLFN